MQHNLTIFPGDCYSSGPNIFFFLLLWNSQSTVRSSFFLLTDNPKTSVMSRSSSFIPFGNFQSKWNNNWASGSSTFGSANNMPGHILLPAPNGINSKFVPMKPTELFRNLSGWNISASGQQLGSLPIAHALIMILVLEDMSNPLTSQFLLHSLGSNRGKTVRIWTKEKSQKRNGKSVWFFSHFAFHYISQYIIKIQQPHI